MLQERKKLRDAAREKSKVPPPMVKQDRAKTEVEAAPLLPEVQPIRVESKATSVEVKVAPKTVEGSGIKRRFLRILAQENAEKKWREEKLTEIGLGAEVIALNPRQQEKPEPEPEPKKPEKVAPGKSLVERKATPLTFQHSKNPTGIPASLENARTAIDLLGADCRYDVFHDRIMVEGHECGIRGDAHENLENVTLKIRQAVLERFGFDPSAGFTMDALKMRCLDHVFDPVRDYLDSLRWDGKPRLNTWLIRYCRAEDTPLNRAIGRKMLVAAVRRVREPGCKFDYIVVLEGDQGVGKSSLLRVLAGEENFSDNEILGLYKREQQEAIQGVWIYEVAELEGLVKSEVTKIKLFASKTVDGARPAYGRSRVDRPRRCIFVATTNEDTYLRDTTGNRRFWPVCVGVIDLSAVRRDRDQLWAEASVVEADGEPLVIGQELWGDVAAQQDARMEVDPWEDTIARELGRLIRLGNAKETFMIDGNFAKAADARGDPEWRVSTDHLLSNVLRIPEDRQNNNHTKRLAGIMRNLGWLRYETPLRIGKEVRRGFTVSCAG
jgi:predicted P-loop ATPase